MVTALQTAEPTVTVAARPEVSCRVSRTILHYVRACRDGELGELLDGLGVDETCLLDTNNWVSQDVIQTLFQRTVDLLGDEAAIFKAPLVTAQPKSRGLLPRMLHLLGSPQFVYAQAPLFGRMLRTTSRIAVIKSGDAHAVIEERFPDKVRKTRYDCDYMRGMLAMVPVFFGMPPADVEEVECQLSIDERGYRLWAGDPVTWAGRCLYRVQWDPSKRQPFWARRLLSRRRSQNAAFEELLRAYQSIQLKYAEARQLAARLDVSEQRYRLLAENVSDIIWKVRLDTMKFSYVSPSATRILGYPLEGAAKVGFEEILAPESLHQAYQILTAELARDGEPGVDPERSVTQEVQIRCADGTYKWAESKAIFLRDAEGRPNRILGVVRDITERKRAEEEAHTLACQLEHAKRMEAVGNLAAGVAHDLNNMLSSIVGYPEMMLMDLPADSPLRPHLQTMHRSGKKAAAIVQDLLTIARLETGSREVLDLNDVVAEYRTSAEQKKLQEQHPGVVLEVLASVEALPVKGSPVHLSKMLMNLAANAAEAMPAGGRIRLRTGRVKRASPLNGHETVPPGEYVHLEVADEGVGIPRGDVKRIFEPFFTRKQMAHSGTGLGMTVIWATVKDHHGFLDVTSREGAGTRFDLFFPVARAPLAPKPQPADLADHLGCGTILVVDDLEEQREITANMLRKLGYEVETAGNGAEALACLARRPADLVVLDMFLEPDADGLDAYREITALNPGQKAILVSGSTTLERVKAAQALGAGEFLPKPFTLEALGMAVRRELERR